PARRAPAPSPGAALSRAALARGGSRGLHGPRPPAPGAPDGRLGSLDPGRARARVPDVADVRTAARSETRSAYGSVISKTIHLGTKRSPRGIAVCERWTMRKCC